MVLYAQFHTCYYYVMGDINLNLRLESSAEKVENLTTSHGETLLSADIYSNRKAEINRMAQEGITQGNFEGIFFLPEVGFVIKKGAIYVGTDHTAEEPKSLLIADKGFSILNPAIQTHQNIIDEGGFRVKPVKGFSEL